MPKYKFTDLEIANDHIERLEEELYTLRRLRSIEDQSLIDRFAAAALTGLLANPEFDYASRQRMKDKTTAEHAYEIAQGMMEERNARSS